MPYPRNDHLTNAMLPVDVVLGPAWWHHHEGIAFDEDFFFHPAAAGGGRAANGTGALPGAGADSNLARNATPTGRYWGPYTSRPATCSPPCSAAAFNTARTPRRKCSLPTSPISTFPPKPRLPVPNTGALKSAQALATRFGYVQGDVNWGGLLNIALDLRGQTFLTDLFDEPEQAERFLSAIAAVVERFTERVAAASGSTSVSVNRNVRHIRQPVYLHSECSHVMISVGLYQRFLMGFDVVWSQTYRPFGIHYCGADPHRYAEAFARLPHLDFLDVGAGGDVCELPAPAAADVPQPAAQPGRDRPAFARRNPPHRPRVGAAVGQPLVDGRVLHQHGPARQRRAGGGDLRRNGPIARRVCGHGIVTWD